MTPSQSLAANAEFNETQDVSILTDDERAVYYQEQAAKYFEIECQNVSNYFYACARGLLGITE